MRIETLEDHLDPITEPDAKRLVGGSLTTLLYMTQIAAISQDPWFSRVQSPLDADYCAIDLGPSDEATFDRVLDVARWVRDELPTRIRCEATGERWERYAEKFATMGGIVEAFMDGRLTFMSIAEVVDSVLNTHQPTKVSDVETILDVDAWARREAVTVIARMPG